MKISIQKKQEIVDDVAQEVVFTIDFNGGACFAGGKYSFSLPELQELHEAISKVLDKEKIQ